MAQWDNLGSAATIAQLTGLDALGLISTILQAAQTVRHNRETCQELVQDLQMMEDLLKLLREPEMMRQDEIKNVLNGLDRTLKEADSLVQSCRDCTLAYRVFMGWKQSDQFRRVKKKIAKHLKFYPMVSHADITRRLEELGKTVQSSSSSSQQEAQEEHTSSTRSQNHEARNRVGTPVEIEIEPVEIEMAQAATESTTAKEHQQAGNNENIGSFRTIKWRFGLKLPLSRKKWSMVAQKKEKVETPSFTCEVTGLDLTSFQFTQLCAATDNFASECKIGSLELDDVYKGRLPDGLDIMIKRRRHPNTLKSSDELRNEVLILTKLRHMNIVKLVGLCTERGEGILVYEYMANGRLSDAITSGHGSGYRLLNYWPERFKIIIGIARGLLYLHECCGTCIIQCGLSPQSILLDSHMAPKITDFLHASNYDQDKHGDSLQDVTGELINRTEKVKGRRNDIYRFGLTLLQIITRKHLFELCRGNDYDPLEFWTVETIAQKIDPDLCFEPQTEIRRCIQVALLCVGSNEDDSPSMWDVLLMLSCESVVIPEVPRSRQEPEASGSGWAHNDVGELSDSDIVEPR